MATLIRMPQLAAGGDAAAVQAWLVRPGDAVTAGQPIAEIETEKAVVEYESDTAGIFAGSLVTPGDWTSVGAPIAVIAAQGEPLDVALAGVGVGREGMEAAAVEATVRDLPDGPGSLAETPQRAADRASSAQRILATPIVRRLAAQRGIDVRLIAGNGPNGRITRRDLDAYLEQRAEAAETRVVVQAPPVSRPIASGPAFTDASFTDHPHTGMRRAIARRLAESKATVPHFYLVADARVDELLALRERINEDPGMRVSVNDFVLKAVAGALQDVPGANAIWTDDATRQFQGVDLAMAVSVPNGLVTPVLRGADQLSVGALSARARDLAGRAREGRLKQNELEGGTFTVSNLGMYGTRQFAAIINPPHAGILAVGAATKRPVVTDAGDLGVATVMTVTLSADHRVLDGALAAEWLAAFVKRIENPLSVLL
jgi:pyruvate dehydrogenase E2 component (dihydrolipoamide acetyltransferase)